MTYTFEMIDEVLTEKNDDFVELRKDETNIYSALDLWKGDVVTLQRESGKQVLAVIIGFDEESTLMNVLELETEKTEGKYIDEATVILNGSDEQETYYVNCMKPFFCKGTCIGELYGTVILKDINNIAIDISVAFGLKASFFDGPCTLNTRIADHGKKKDKKDKRDVMPSYKDAVSIYSASLKKQNAELKQEIQVLRGKLENPKGLSANQTDIKNLEGKIEFLTTENTGKDRRIKDLTGENGRLESKVNELNRVIENKNRELKTSRDVSKSQRNTITTNSAELKRIKNERDMLAKKNTELSDLAENLKAEKKTTERTLVDIQNENNQLKKTVDKLTVEINSIEVERIVQITSIESEKNDLSREVEKLRDENKMLLSKVENIKEETTKKDTCEAKTPTHEENERVVTSNTDIEMRVHDLELSLEIYKELYRSVMDKLIAKH